jgi:hypothetical protein
VAACTASTQQSTVGEWLAGGFFTIRAACILALSNQRMPQSIHKEVFRLNGALPFSPEVEEWLGGTTALHALAREWFACMRQCGNDVVELLHDGCPVACVGDVAFAYVNVFKAHMNVGFFMGAFLDDPRVALEGTGKRMRHVKLRVGHSVDSKALTALIQRAYALAKAAQ